VNPLKLAARLLNPEHLNLVGEVGGVVQLGLLDSCSLFRIQQSIILCGKVETNI
jgi:hypothetical protein